MVNLFTSEVLPAGVLITISFAESFKALDGTFEVEEDQKVWRLEFEFKRQALLELGVEKVEQLLPSQDGLWRYASQTWLRLTLPNPHDENQSRWPTHPLWEALSSVQWSDEEHPPLTRRHPRQHNNEPEPSDIFHPASCLLRPLPRPLQRH